MAAPWVYNYLQTGISSTPTVLDRLCAGLTAEEIDRRPFLDRFTLREAIAHMADWEGVWQERINRIVNEDEPFLPGYDEGQWAIDHDYAHSDFAEQLARFRTGRADLCTLLAGLTPYQWMRTGIRDEIGSITVYDQAVLLLGHDGYHLRQVVEYRAG